MNETGKIRIKLRAFDYKLLDQSTKEIVDTAKKEIFKSNEMNYLLAKKSYSYDLGNTRLNSAQKYAVQVNTDKDDKVVEFQISD